MKKSFLFLSLSFFFFLSPLFAQNTLLKGVVYDENDEPLVGATVWIAGTGTGTYSDMEGRYQLFVEAGQHIVSFRYMGYENTSVEVNLSKSSKTVLNPTLKSADMLIPEVVIVAYKERHYWHCCNCYRLSVDSKATDSIAIKIDLESFQIFPNPAVNTTTLSLPYDVDWVGIFDESGKLVRTQNQLPAGTHTLTVSDLTPGTYVVTIQERQRLTTKKLVVLNTH